MFTSINASYYKLQFLSWSHVVSWSQPRWLPTVALVAYPSFSSFFLKYSSFFFFFFYFFFNFFLVPFLLILLFFSKVFAPQRFSTKTLLLKILRRIRGPGLPRRSSTSVISRNPRVSIHDYLRRTFQDSHPGRTHAQPQYLSNDIHGTRRSSPVILDERSFFRKITKQE